jgi:hypothetical protein
MLTTGRFYNNQAVILNSYARNFVKNGPNLEEMYGLLYYEVSKFGTVFVVHPT